MKTIILILSIITLFKTSFGEVKLFDKSGREIPLPKDKILILNFISYSCGHCMAEIPVFKKVLSKQEFRGRFILYTFSLDGKENNFKDPEFPIYANNSKNNVLFPTMGTPTTYIISPSGKKLEVIYGSITEKSLESFLQNSLRKNVK
ncbi:MAG: TlpA family protein disulfide reductase [Hydrogenothermaceae bacterium]|nr:TlpA family protein disulfide reductase [Hydrogenothermaceae bacterium]